MHVLLHVCLALVEVRRKYQIFWNRTGVTDILSCLMGARDLIQVSAGAANPPDFETSLQPLGYF